MNIYKTKNPLPPNLNYLPHRYPQPPELQPPLVTTTPLSSNMTLFSNNLNGKGKCKGNNGNNYEEVANRKISPMNNCKNPDFDL
jgi:hypothetical protein